MSGNQEVFSQDFEENPIFGHFIVFEGGKMLNFFFLILSLIPSVAVIILLRCRRRDSLTYKKYCKYSFSSGLISSLVIIAITYVFDMVMLSFSQEELQKINVVGFNFFFSFIFMALLEEAAKYTAFRLLLLNKNQTFSWADVTAFMVIVGAAFQMVENMFYAFSYPASSPLRGLLLLHIAYGFIMGWFYGKRLYSGKKLYAVIGFVVTWLIHGTLIFCLTPKIVELNHNLVIIGNILSVVLFAILVLAIIFFITAKKKEKYNKKIFPAID